MVHLNVFWMGNGLGQVLDLLLAYYNYSRHMSTLSRTIIISRATGSSHLDASHLHFIQASGRSPCHKIVPPTQWLAECSRFYTRNIKLPVLMQFMGTARSESEMADAPDCASVNH